MRGHAFGLVRPTGPHRKKPVFLARRAGSRHKVHVRLAAFLRAGYCSIDWSERSA